MEGEWEGQRLGLQLHPQPFSIPGSRKAPALIPALHGGTGSRQTLRDTR